MKLGTKLTLYLSLIIVLVLSGYGYVDTLSRRNILIRKMETEVRSTGRTLTVALQEVSPTEEKAYIQGLIDAVGETERTLGVIVAYREGNLLFRSPSLGEGTEPFLDLIRRSIRENTPREEFGTYKGIPVFSYAFPLEGKEGKSVGGVAILHRTSFMEGEITKAKENMFLTIFVLIAILISSRAKLRPGHRRGPPPKGAKAL